jgi:hypothetical protein
VGQWREPLRRFRASYGSLVWKRTLLPRTRLE